MKSLTPVTILCVGWLGLAAWLNPITGFAQTTKDAVAPGVDVKAEPPYGIDKRVPWTTSRLTGTSELPSPYLTERVFPKLKFVEPLELAWMPGSDRIFLAEHAGKIFSFPNDQSCEKPDLFADLKEFNPEVQEIYSVEFHPQFLKNRYVYIWYILKPELPDGTHISRFKVTDSNPPRVDLKTEQLVITWKSGGHNGGCMRFGLDGMFYISTGDGVGPNPPDTLNTGQDISDLLSSILRIDVDHAENGKAYRIPPDNPFVNLPGARPEVWAYGFRNPWRMSIDRKTGDLWTGDVGWQLWEMIYRVQRGGNYGWSIIEGSSQLINPDGQRGPTTILPPTMEHPHSEAASITGGCVYRGKRLPELIGAYIYGDFETGKIWELRHDGSRVTKSRELVDTPFKIISFGEDHDGEIYILDFAGTLQRFVPNPAANTPSTFPRKLSETGLFAAVTKQQPASGVIPFSVNAELWADHAVANRFAAFPQSSGIVLTNDGRWLFPKDAVLAKTLSLENERGNPRILRKVETQILHFTGDAWNAYSYQWNDAQTDALLVPAAGAEQVFAIADADAPGGKRQKTWRYHSRAECLRCHNPWCNTALGFNELQLNKTHRYLVAENVSSQLTTAREAQTRVAANQLRTFVHIGLIDPSCVKSLPTVALVNPHDASADINARARSYLHANCSHCHRENAGGAVVALMNIEAPLEKSLLLGAKPSQGTFGMAAAQVVAAGDPFRSVLFYRLAKLGKGHMPYIGSSLLDERALDLIYEWIKQLPKQADADSETVARLRAEEQAALAKLRASQSLPATERDAVLDRLLSSVSGALALLRAVDEKVFSVSVQEGILAKATAAPDLLVRDLFERFLPDDQRVKTLGSNIRPESILMVKGDAVRGKKLFLQEGGAQCQTCHRLEGVGRDFGPDLSHIGQKYNRAQILENLLEPSKVIDPKFVAYLVQTKSETAHTGFLIKKTASEVVLKDASTDAVRIPTADIARFEPQRLSLMPEQLLQNLTAQEAADLVEFLQSLK